jgi:pyruvate dehydrogenase E2 component (dihydrolipoamide acetyltransferase)
MANLVLLPQMGISEESAVVGEFYVKTGESVQIGTRLFSIETGKSVFDVESEFTGVVLALLCAEGDELPVKAPVMAIGREGETYASPQAETGKPEKRQAEGPATALKAAEVPAAAEYAGDGRGKLTSPRARMLADKAGVDPALAQPTGAEGLIVERDVKRMLDTGVQEGAAVAGTAGFKDIPLSMMRRTIAKAMHHSLQSTAQLTHTASFDATVILAYRKRSREQERTKDVTLGDMVLYTAAQTLKAFPEMNAHFLEDKIRRFESVHLAVAVDIPAGLVAPVIRSADQMSLLQISEEMKRLAEACRAGVIAPELLAGGTFTVTNLGNLGIESFTPILNPPQVGILGVNAITLRPRRADNGTVSFYDCMALSLTYDHRAVDGAPASRFLQALCKNLETFSSLQGGADA